MAKMTAWLMTVIGVLLLLDLSPSINLTGLNAWLIPVLVLVMGVSKLGRSYSTKKKR